MAKWLLMLSLTAAACGSAEPSVEEQSADLCICPQRPNMTSRCVYDGLNLQIYHCAYTCNAGWLDCDGVASNGCETPNDTNNCNTCGRRCIAGNNEVPVCTPTGCGERCAAGWGDCNHNVSDGCETSLETTSNCAYCGFSCGAGQTCEIGVGCSGCGDGICRGSENHTNCPEDCLCASGRDCCGDGSICRASCGGVICP